MGSGRLQNARSSTPLSSCLGAPASIQDVPGLLSGGGFKAFSKGIRGNILPGPHEPLRRTLRGHPEVTQGEQGTRILCGHKAGTGLGLARSPNESHAFRLARLQIVLEACGYWSFIVTAILEVRVGPWVLSTQPGGSGRMEEGLLETVMAS